MDQPPEKLLSTTREDVLQSMEYAMKFRHGKATRAAQDVAVGALAAMVHATQPDGSIEPAATMANVWAWNIMNDIARINGVKL